MANHSKNQGVPLFLTTDSHPQSLSDLLQNPMSILVLEHMYKRFEMNRTKIKGGCQSGRKVIPHDSMSDLPLSLVSYWIFLEGSAYKQGLSF